MKRRQSSSSEGGQADAAEYEAETPAKAPRATPAEVGEDGSSSTAPRQRTYTCSLAPGCDVNPSFHTSMTELEAHWRMSHAFVCLAPAPTPTSSSGTAPSTSAARTSAASTSASSSRGAQRNQQRKTKQTCERVFPSAHLLSLHETEWHDPLAAIRREKGERIYECLQEGCGAHFRTPKGRRLHAIDAHHFPPEYRFNVTERGIGELIDRARRTGSAPTMLRRPYDPSRSSPRREQPRGTDAPAAGDDSTDDEDMRSSSADAPAYSRSPPGASSPPAPQGPASADDEDITLDSDISPTVQAADDELARAFENKVSLVPRTVRFGRKGAVPLRRQ